MNYSLYLILDPTQCQKRSMLDILDEVIDAGITCVQLRMKDYSTEKIVTAGEEILKKLKPKKIPLIINDDIEAAKQIKADGVHIGQLDLDYQQARKQWGYKKIIGLSIENITQAKMCCEWDVDYFGVGPVFATASKIDAAEPIDVKALKEIVGLLKRPAVAIGGINMNNVNDVLSSKVAGIAVISAILGAAQPKQAAQMLAQQIKNFRSDFR